MDSAKTLVSARGIYVAENLLCEHIPVNEVSPEDVVKVLGSNPGQLTQIEVGNIRGKHPSCISCHGEVDKIGMGLEFVDAFGKMRIEYKDKKPIKVSLVVNDELGNRVDNFHDFAKNISTDPRLHACFVKTLSNKVAAINLKESQPCVETSMVNNYSGGIQDYVKQIVLSKIFKQSIKGKDDE